MIALGGYQQDAGINITAGPASALLALPGGASHLYISNLSGVACLHCRLGDATVVATVPASPAWGSNHIPPGGDAVIAIGTATHLAYISSVAVAGMVSAVIPHKG